MANKLGATSSENEFLSQEERLVIIEASFNTMKDRCVLDGEVDLNVFAAKAKDANRFELRNLAEAAYVFALAEQFKRDINAPYGPSIVLTLSMAHLDKAWNDLKKLRRLDLGSKSSVQEPARGT